MQKGEKRSIRAWVMYDWANSVYSLTITTAIFPIYYNAVTSKGGETVEFLGTTFTNTVLYSYSLSFAFLLVAVLVPALSGIADYSGSKKRFMEFFCYLGSVSCAALYFFTDKSDINLAIFASVLACVGYAGSIVFYNAFLPEIAEPKDQDRISARGFSMGYIGSSLLLVLNLAMVMSPQTFGIVDADGVGDTGMASRISFITVALWWAGFAQISFRGLKEDSTGHEREDGLIGKGYAELRKVWAELKTLPRLKNFLIAFFIYNMAVQTVMYLATIFGDKELKLETAQLITTVLIIQFVAIGGAWLFSRISAKQGNIKALLLAIVIWIGVCIMAYFVYDANGFYAIAFIVGLVMGGIQALSRSTYSKLLPETQDHASYFSFYDVCDRIGTVAGTFMYGLIESLTGSMRNSIIALTLFFIVGMIALFRVPKTREVEPTEV